MSQVANPTWALVAAPDALRAIARLRQIPGLEVCEAGGEIWLRGSSLDESLANPLRLIPGGRQFRVFEGSQLIAAGRLVPCGQLPAGPWLPLANWLTLELPPLRSRV